MISGEVGRRVSKSELRREETQQGKDKRFKQSPYQPGKSSASFDANVGLLGQVQEQAGRIKRNMSATGTLTSLLCLPLLFAFSLASGEKKKAPSGSGVRAKLEGNVKVKVKVIGHLS